MTEIKNCPFCDGGGGLFLGPDETQELLAHIERLNEEVASWQRVHRAELEKTKRLESENARLKTETIRCQQIVRDQIAQMLGVETDDVAGIGAAIEGLKRDAERLNFIERYWFYQSDTGYWLFGFNETWDAGKHDELRDAITNAMKPHAGREAN